MVGNADRYASAWDHDEDMRRHLVWERATLGAAVTLGKRPASPSRHAQIVVDNDLPRLPPPPEPLGSIPEWAISNWRAIVDEVLDHYGLKLTDIIRRSGKHSIEVACSQEIAYRLIKYGHWNGQKMTTVRVGKILRRHYSTIIHSVRMHELRLKRLRPQFPVEDAEQ